MQSDPITLYYGDNGSHEFYETGRAEARHLLIIRHHARDADGTLMCGPDSQWFVLECEFDNGPRPVYRGWQPLSAVIRDVATKCAVSIAIDPHFGWRDVGQRRMKLQPI